MLQRVKIKTSRPGSLRTSSCYKRNLPPPNRLWISLRWKKCVKMRAPFVTAFSQMLQFVDLQAKKSAQALFESVPQSLREQYPSPEKLIAFLAVKDVPLGSVKLTQSSDLVGWASPASDLKLLMVNADGTRKNTDLVFMKSDEVWKLVVTDRVIAKYAAALQGLVGSK